MVCNVVPGPGHGLDHLLCYVRNGDRQFGCARTQSVVHHHHTCAHVMQRRRHKRMIGFVKAAPIAAMNKNHHGRIGLAGWKDVQAFVGAIAVGNVERAFQGSTRVSRSLRPICKMRCMVWHQGAVVVHAVVPSCTVGFHGHLPLNFHFQSHLHILPIARVGVRRF